MSTLYEAELSSTTLSRLLGHVYTFTGIKMDEKKRSMLQGRIRSRANKLNISSYDAYLEFLENNPDEVQGFVNAVTTNETSFYRTPRVWDYFIKEFLPAWTKGNPNQTLKIWSAAASSGEEAHTMAIFCEEFKLLSPSFQYQILATDISTEVLEKAKNGVFSVKSIDNIRNRLPLLFAKYFSAQGDSYNANPALRKNIRFIPHNLFKPLRNSDKFNIVFLRNVLIYFSAADQECVLANIWRSTESNGILVLGESESLNGLKTSFKFLAPLIYKADKEI